MLALPVQTLKESAREASFPPTFTGATVTTVTTTTSDDDDDLIIIGNHCFVGYHC